jgi:hypothetical protein
MKAGVFTLIQVVRVELTERNLRTLLFKLEREDSLRTLEIIAQGDPPYIVQVVAVDNEAHYSDRDPGRVHPEEEARL